MPNETILNTKNKTLQGLRGYGFLLIFISHCNLSVNQYGANTFTWLGALGASVFLMLSGYLLLHGYVCENKALGTMKQRLKKRLKRVYPLHIITLLLSLPLMYKSLLSAEWIKHTIIAVLNVLLLHGYVPKSSVYFSYNAVSWYLCVLMLCTAISPMVVKICLRLREKYLLIGLGILVSTEFVLYFVLGKCECAHWILYVFPFVRVIDFLLGGMTFLLVDRFRNNGKRIELLSIVGSMIILTILVMLSLESKDEIYATACWAIPVVMLILGIGLCAEDSKMMRSVFENRIIVFIGNISFELFLFHQLIIKYSNRVWNKMHLPNNSNLQYLFALVLSILFSYYYQKFERFMRNRSSCKR